MTREKKGGKRVPKKLLGTLAMIAWFCIFLFCPYGEYIASGILVFILLYVSKALPSISDILKIFKKRGGDSGKE